MDLLRIEFSFPWVFTNFHFRLAFERGESLVILSCKLTQANQSRWIFFVTVMQSFATYQCGSWVLQRTHWKYGPFSTLFLIMEIIKDLTATDHTLIGTWFWSWHCIFKLSIKCPTIHYNLSWLNLLRYPTEHSPWVLIVFAHCDNGFLIVYLYLYRPIYIQPSHTLQQEHHASSAAGYKQ